MASNERDFENRNRFDLDDDFFAIDDDASIYELTGIYKADDEVIPIELAEDYSDGGAAASGDPQDTPFPGAGKVIAAVLHEGPARMGRTPSIR